jgi:hypothetical protein
MRLEWGAVDVEGDGDVLRKGWKSRVFLFFRLKLELSDDVTTLLPAVSHAR